MKDFVLAGMLKNPKVTQLVRAAETGNLPAYCTGMSETYKLFLTLLLTEGGRGILVVPDAGEGQKMLDLFSVLIPPEGLMVVPAREYVFHNIESMSRQDELARIHALDRLMRGDYRLAILPADALMQLTAPPQVLAARRHILRAGDTVELDGLLGRLAGNGYTRTELTEGPGQFSQRGGIVEFFSPAADYPVRLELFGDQIDSLSFYDPKTQRRIREIPEATLLPALEALPDKPMQERIKILIQKQLEKLDKRRDDDAVVVCRRDLEGLDHPRYPAIDRFLPMIHPAGPTTLDYDPQAKVFCYDLPRLREAFSGFAYRVSNDIVTLAEKGFPVAKGEYTNNAAALLNQLSHRGLILLEDFLRQENDIPFKLVQGYTVKSLTPVSGDAALCEEVKYYLEGNQTTVVFAGSGARATYLPSVFTEHNLPCFILRDGEEDAGRQAPGGDGGGAAIIGRGFPGGFHDRDAGLAVLGSTRISGRKKSRGRYKRGDKIHSFSDIKIGDYIVHENYGIGVYDGVHKVQAQGTTRDFIRIQYAGTDALFIPCGQFDLISKYVGASDNTKVKLNKLGTGEWARAKARVSANVRDLAQGLIALYSARQQLEGHAFSPDNDWQRQFESAFEFEETDDQRECTDEIKADMEKPAPMDRLLCGDVGFGKTEVALRAAFKCVLDNKQVAMLVPTTLLAWQHYNTMLRRFEGFPVTIELLSRFRTPAQQQVILRRLRRGEIDIVVGTHRIIQKDIKFKDLGLLIVDEEQRFGVSHKENLKEMFRTVDVLTLSATPIPRTLNMALAGIRDMSALEEPPSDRHPVSTYVCEYDEGLVTDALRRELARGGQCYYLYNRVESIYRTAARLEQSLPGAVIEVAHGQMEKDELSEIWDRMTQGKTDILVCTTIIETGVDIPNANTLIIEDADRLGLAQLHQIRGRVGRSHKHAYAYLTYRKGRALTEDGRKRLDAIREYTEFGAGFKIAMRDLQIRGAGNLLGAQQHGHMDSVGYDMYMQLLGEAIDAERGVAKKPKSSECLIDLRTDAFIPEEYIDSAVLRVDIYKKIAGIETEQDCSDIIDELIERFGEPPAPVLALIDISLIRVQAGRAGIVDLAEKNGMLLLRFLKYDMRRVADIISAFKGRMYFSAGSDPHLSCRIRGDAVDTALEVCRVLEEMGAQE